MTSLVCPSCGTVASEGAVTCARCHSSLAIPASAEPRVLPILRSPTARGEAKQRELGVHTTVLAQATPRQPSTYSRVYGADGNSAPAPAPNGVGPAPAPASPWGEQWAPPEPGSRVSAPAPERSHGGGWTQHPPVGAAPAATEPAPVKSSLPAAEEETKVQSSAGDQTRPGEGEARPRPARHDPTAWPPPPGPWSGRRTTET